MKESVGNFDEAYRRTSKRSPWAYFLFRTLRWASFEDGLLLEMGFFSRLSPLDFISRFYGISIKYVIIDMDEISGFFHSCPSSHVKMSS